jgi:CheY-like chemotaxis protein
VQADAGMMEQILLNLAVNSRDAMPGGGILNISISRPNIGPEYLENHPEAHIGHHVCLCVKDTGCGIEPRNLRRIFEPFFTTKPIGKGTGLGLATVYGIVKQHQGWVEVESQPGKGSVFRVFLPLSTEPAESGAEIAPAQAVRGGTETILVVEDELPVRELVCTLLASHGYKILEASSGAHALEVWGKHKEQVDLVLTDLVMPGRLNGYELAERLRQDQPKLKVIFTSGYSAEVVGVDVATQKGIEYLQKPYQPQQLAMVIRECLDSVEGGTRVLCKSGKVSPPS